MYIPFEIVSHTVVKYHFGERFVKFCTLENMDDFNGGRA